MNARFRRYVLLVVLGIAPALASAGEQVAKGKQEGLMTAITAQREAIEGRLDSLQRTTLTTESMREQIKQKWQKIDFYSDGKQVLRIKTYPHPGISTRTEEFYFDGGHLILAYIEDKGTEDTEPDAHHAGKEYFYHHGKFVGERNMTDETEHAIRHSDEERLEQEATEYLALYTAKGK